MRLTLAKEFIDRKLNEYEEPVRKGKAKGEAVGLGRIKYTAALVMAVYAMNTREVEEIIGMKRSLISKWRTEPKFLQQIEEMRIEYGEEVLQALIAGGNSSAFADAHHYSGEVKNMMVGMADKAAERGDGDFLLRSWPVLRSVMWAAWP